VTIPDSPNDLLVNRLVVQKGGKALVVRTLIGDVHINQETMQASKRKLWRSLSTFTYPSQRLEHDLATNYAGHLTIQLHKTFRDAGYMTFTGMISMADENLMNMEFSSVTLTTNQAGYVGAIHNSVKQLWDIKQDRLALQNALNTELRDLHSNWIVDVRVFRDPGPIAYQFVYDPDARKIFIGPCEKISTAPSEYPDKAGSTSELLMLLTAVLRSEFAIAGNIETILNSYPLSKLFIELMDSKTVDLGRVRVNAADVEEWDYVNPAADEEFDRVGGQ
jgi:hypothetical protein